MKAMCRLNAVMCATVLAAATTAAAGEGDERPPAASRAEAAPVTVRVGADAVGRTMRYIGASGIMGRGSCEEFVRESDINVTKAWWELASIEKKLLSGDVRGRPTKKEVLEKGPEKAFDWEKLERWYRPLADKITRCRELGAEFVPNLFPRDNKSRLGKGRWGVNKGPGCPTTEEDWHEWWRGCFVIAYYFNVKAKLNQRLWEIGCEPWGGTSQRWQRRDGKFGSTADMARFVRVGADAIRTACKYANVEPVIGANGETFTWKWHGEGGERWTDLTWHPVDALKRVPIHWWEEWVKDPVTNAHVDALSIHTFGGFRQRKERLDMLNDFINFSKAHPQPRPKGEKPRVRKLWDTSWSVEKDKGGPGQTSSIGYALMMMGKIIDESDTFFDMTIVFHMSWGDNPLMLPKAGPDGKRTYEPTVSAYALRMAARAMAGGKERLPVSGMPTTVEKGPDKPYESYEAGEECFLCTAGRDEESVFVTFLNATGIHRAVKLDLSALKLAGRDYVVRELSGSRNDEEVARGTMGAGPLDVASGGASALQVEVKR